MPGRLGPRFAVETLFLLALAVGAGLADLATRWILVIMAAGWLIVALLELTAERMWSTVPAWRRPNYYPAAAVAPPPAPPPVVEPEPEVEIVPAPPEVTAPEPEPETIIVTSLAAEAARAPEPPLLQEPKVEAEPEPELETEQQSEPEPEPEPAADGRPRLEPLEPRSKRRWFGRRREEEQIEPEADPMPKHVRLLPTAPREDRVADEVAELFDSSEREERSRP